jgi:ABC-type nitrate/sulfonate/bicarbonate transport system substrate-binding protein
VTDARPLRTGDGSRLDGDMLKQTKLFSVALLALPVFAAPVPAAERMRLGVSVKSVVFLPFYYGYDRKIFEKHGIQLEIISMRSDLQMVGLVSGELDFNPAIGPATLAISSGMPLKVVGVFYRAPLLSLLAPAQITRPKDLEGKKVAVSRIGSESHRYGALMLENSGVDEKKVTFIQTGSTTVSLAALQQGAVAAAVLSPPFTGQMARQGYKVLVSSRDLIEAPWLGVVTSRQKIQKQPEHVRNFLLALRETLRSVRQDRAGVVAYIQKTWQVAPGVAEEAYEDIAGVMVDDLVMPEERVNNFLERAQSRGELGKKPLMMSEIFDYSFARGLK